MAAPHVAGVAALMLSVNPNLTPSQVESILKSSARAFPSGSTCSTSNCGVGIIDARAAVLAAQGNGGGNNPTDGTLTNGVAKTGLSGLRGSEQFFTIDVPANATNLTFTMSGGSGDADLYVRKGSKPTTSNYDCRPYKSGNNENCSVVSPSADSYHVMIRAYSAYSDVSLVADYTAGTGGGGGGNGTDSVTNNTNYSISDYSTVASPVTVSGRSHIGSIEVTIDIKHTYIGDLVVKLLTPDGKSATLSNRAGGGTNNLQKTYSFDASSVANGGNGVWKLQVEDRGRGDTGYIDGWTLKFK